GRCLAHRRPPREQQGERREQPEEREHEAQRARDPAPRRPRRGQGRWAEARWACHGRAFSLSRQGPTRPPPRGELGAAAWRRGPATKTTPPGGGSFLGRGTDPART